MKPWKIVLGICAVTLSGLVLAGALVARSGRALDASSLAYVDDAVPAMTKRWALSDFQARASPEFLAAAPREKLEPLVAALARKLGPLKRYDGAKGESFMNFTPTGRQITARYLVTAEYERGSATLDVRLVQHAGRWGLFAFHVSSDALLR